MEQNMNLTVGFKGGVTLNGLPVYNHDGAPPTVGGFISTDNTETAYFGRVVSALTSDMHDFLLGAPALSEIVGILQNDYAVNQYAPVHNNYIPAGEPATALVFGEMWLGSFTHAGAGTLTSPTRNSVVIFKNTTGQIEFLAAGTAVPTGYTVLDAKVIDVNTDTNNVLLFVGISKAETQTPVPSSTKALQSFSIVATGATGFSAVGNIVESTGVVAVTVPAGTTVTALVANFVHTGSTIEVNDTEQVSGVTTNNFTSPVVYTVTASDGTTKNYTVTVTVHS